MRVGRGLASHHTPMLVLDYALLTQQLMRQDIGVHCSRQFGILVPMSVLRQLFARPSLVCSAHVSSSHVGHSSVLPKSVLRQLFSRRSLVSSTHVSSFSVVPTSVTRQFCPVPTSIVCQFFLFVRQLRPRELFVSQLYTPG